MKKCTRCLNDSTVRRMNYDENGVCGYCRSYDSISGKLSDRERLEQLFFERIENIRGKYDYDVALGISGGKDSVFVLHELVKRYGLKVKTFTMLNGFFSDAARKNVDKLVQEFGVEHEYIEFDKDLLNRFYRYSMQHWLAPCVACSYIGYAAMINYTTKINAGLCIHGRSPQQMLRYYGDDVFTPLINAGLKSIHEVDLNALYTELLSSIEDRMDKELLADVKGMLCDCLDGGDFREFMSYFLYHDYDEQHIVSYLRENTSWTPDVQYDHYDCRIHNAAHYIYECAEGRPHCLPEVSVLVRSGRISREEGIALVNKEHYYDKPYDELNLLSDTVGINLGPVLLKANIYKLLPKK
ncbi:MAG: hypothetical protein IJZ47_04795 [Oscillospiraceae bacterium]|nr:hypothetical protein [Oscillospiraceae bacterium]